ncbi:MAG: phosphoribosylformylglycinamidine synthase I [Desulfobacterales bacterium]|nr:phosphoribosylformylglycinamidine synthase I [Desulfobacterales bacterium]
MSKVKALVLSGYGLNCDHETAYAFDITGAEPKRVHINGLIDGTETLKDYKILVFIGGFSWGDDHGAGVVQSIRLKTHIGDQILEFIEKGNLVLGICNGFQTLVNMGLLPGLNGDYTDRKVALTWNDSGNFRDEWVKMKVNEESPCIFTKGLKTLELPIRHGEGKFVAEDDVIKQLQANNQIVVKYADQDYKPAEMKFPDNPNGSMLDIAGICDPTGRIFGLMPHPEGFNHYTNHPDWTAKKQQALKAGTPFETGITEGMQIFKNAVDYFS